MKASIAVLALLSVLTRQDLVRAINTDLNSGSLSELERYVGSDGKYINLAQTEGHLRLELSKVKKFAGSKPIDSAVL